MIEWSEGESSSELNLSQPLIFYQPVCSAPDAKPEKSYQQGLVAGFQLRRGRSKCHRLFTLTLRLVQEIVRNQSDRDYCGPFNTHSWRRHRSWFDLGSIHGAKAQWESKQHQRLELDYECVESPDLWLLGPIGCFVGSYAVSPWILPQAGNNFFWLSPWNPHFYFLLNFSMV